MHKKALRNQRRDTTFSCRLAPIIYGYEQRGLNTQLNFLVTSIFCIQYTSQHISF